MKFVNFSKSISSLLGYILLLLPPGNLHNIPSISSEDLGLLRFDLSVPLVGKIELD